jgi:hypothetical protein
LFDASSNAYTSPFYVLPKDCSGAMGAMPIDIAISFAREVLFHNMYSLEGLVGAIDACVKDGHHDTFATVGTRDGADRLDSRDVGSADCARLGGWPDEAERHRGRNGSYLRVSNVVCAI